MFKCFRAGSKYEPESLEHANDAQIYLIKCMNAPQFSQILRLE